MKDNKTIKAVLRSILFIALYSCIVVGISTRAIKKHEDQYPHSSKDYLNAMFHREFLKSDVYGDIERGYNNTSKIQRLIHVTDLILDYLDVNVVKVGAVPPHFKLEEKEKHEEEEE